MALVHAAVRRVESELASLCSSNSEERPADLRIRMQDIMTEKVGVFRTGTELAAAVEELSSLLERSRNIGLRYRVAGANPELVAAYRVRKMLKVALCIACGALARTESRGAHFREDYPRRDDARWLARTLATWPDAEATQPALAWEALDVDAMELPPGWRGYGAHDHIPHPQTAARTAAIEALRQSSTNATRAALQQQLMPYASLLPERYRASNERIDDPTSAPAAQETHP
jgi:fumarate reductase flavoprotein subunit